MDKVIKSQVETLIGASLPTGEPRTLRPRSVTMAVVGGAALMISACAAQPSPAATAATTAPTVNPGPSTVRGVHHVAITVTDLDRSLALYQGGIGLKLDARRNMTDAGALAEAAGRKRLRGEEAMLSGPNVRIRLISYASAMRETAEVMPVSGPGYTHICFQGRHDDPIYPAALAAGATPLTRGGKPVDLANTGYLYMYNRDPDGAMFELEEALKPRFSERMWVSHVAHATPDLDRLAGFYTAVFGVEQNRKLTGLKGPTFDQTSGLDGVVVAGTWINLKNITLEFWDYDSPPPAGSSAERPITAPGYSYVMYEVDDLDNEIRRVTAAGGRIVTKVSAKVSHREVFARDLDGNLIGLVEMPADDPSSVSAMRAADR